MRNGKVVVLVCGTFDGIHAGHLELFEFAKRQGKKLQAALKCKGTHLQVIVARDANVERIKGKRPLHGEKSRSKLVSSLRQVDGVTLGHPTDFMASVKKIRPDLVVLGFDQDNAMEAKLHTAGFKRIVRCKPFRREAMSITKLKGAGFQHKI